MERRQRQRWHRYMRYRDSIGATAYTIPRQQRHHRVRWPRVLAAGTIAGAGHRPPATGAGRRGGRHHGVRLG